MDYKDRYNRLLDAIKELQKANPSDEGIQNWINDNVPELKLSEDERIRKEIIDFLWKEKIFLQEAHLSVENSPKYRFVVDAIAWLEKQGSPIIFNSSNVGKNEQKPAWGEEDDQGYEDVVWCINKALQICYTQNETSTCWSAQRFINSIKQRLGGGE